MSSARLHELLALERKALLVGEYASLAKLNDEKLQLLEQMDLRALEPTERNELVDAIRAMHRISEGALQGVQSVLEDYRSRRDARSKLATYDRYGAPQTISAPVSEGKIRRA